MSDITVRLTSIPELDPRQYAVTIQDAGGATQHRVTLSNADWNKLGQGRHSPETCIEAAFRFLLEREPKESILGTFDLMLIAHYFPEFPEFLTDTCQRGEHECPSSRAGAAA